MAKKKVERPKDKFTKRQLSRWQQQQRRQRIIMSIGVSVIAVVIGLIIAGIYYGWYLAEYKPLKQTVIEVNNTKFNMDYYIKTLRHHAGGQDAQYIEFLLAPVLESIEQGELIREKALELGISISDSAVSDELDSRELPHNQAVSDIVRTQLLFEKLRQEYFDPQLPPSAEQRHIMAMFLESQSQAAEARVRLETGEDFAQLASELSLDSLTKEEAGDLGWRPRGVLEELLDTPLFENFVFDSEVGLLSQPLYDEDKSKSLGYWLIRVLERDEETEEAHVQAILLTSWEEAQNIKARLEAGEDFAQVAGELSQLPGADENKGDLDWLTPGNMSQAIDDFIFSPETELGIISEPIGDETATTNGGYWLFEVLDSSTREISDEDRNSLISKTMNDWLTALMDDPENRIVSYLNDEMRAFATSRVQAS
ncbi:MAG: hypothetical protein CL873_01645 [Dehalococcoidales bacterium]|nr:hypothetical protein [Dehalococcoidales bacterium]